MGDPAPEGLAIEAVDWLPSGGRSGLVRVRGSGSTAELPQLLIDHRGELHRHTSLPDTAPGEGWRGAYVVHTELIEASADRMSLQWPDGTRSPLPRPSGTAERAPVHGEVVDRAVLAERRARRAEAAEHAQARIAREALKAVEVLELRAAEVEQRLEAVTAERDSLAAAAGGADAALRLRMGEAEEREGALRAELDQLRSVPSEDPALRVERLREALSASVLTVADLRMQLHELRVRRRTTEIARIAESVRLGVLASERAAVTAELQALRTRLREAEQRDSDRAAAIGRADARAAGEAAAHAETRRILTERVGELGEARRRLADLEAGLAAARADAERLAAEHRAAGATEHSLRAALTARDEALVQVHAEAEAALAELRSELARTETALRQERLAHELAEAAAAGAAVERRAADVARAALSQQVRDAVPSGELARLRERLDSLARELDEERGRRHAAEIDLAAIARPPSRPLADLAAQQVEAAEAARTEPDPARERVVADLAAAAVAARERVVTPVAKPAGAPLRRAVVALAREDPVAATWLIVGLLPAQWRAVTAPLDYDLTIGGKLTFAVTVSAGSAAVERIERPRGRRADLHLRTDAVTLAEMLAGAGPRPRRFGKAKLTGSRRQRRALLAAPDLSLADVLEAGADIDPTLALRTLVHAIPPEWTAGHAFAVAFDLPRGRTTLSARDGRGVALSEDEPDETVRADSLADLLAIDSPGPAGTLRDWARRLGA